MTHHFGVLIPSTNTTVEIEFRGLPPSYQAHFARLMTTTPGFPFAPGRDEDIDYQSRLLGTAKVEMVVLIQTSASLFTDDYDEVTMRRMSAGAGVPSITSAHAVGRALAALGARRIALVSPYSEEVNAKARRYFSAKHGLAIAALDGFAATDSYAIGRIGPENARAAFARIDRPEIDAFVVPGGNFATLSSIDAWEREFGKPVVTTNQACVWAVARALGGEPIAGAGRLLAQLPAGWALLQEALRRARPLDHPCRIEERWIERRLAPQVDRWGAPSVAAVLAGYTAGAPVSDRFMRAWKAIGALADCLLIALYPNRSEEPRIELTRALRAL